MAISRCQEIVISRKKFSEFDYYAPVSKEDCDNLFLAGYTEDEHGNKQNVKLRASTFINATIGETIDGLDQNTKTDLITFINDKVDNKNIRVAYVNNDNIKFIQINNISDSLFSLIDGKEYFVIRISENMPLGTVLRFYLPNFKKGKGVMLLPTSGTSEKSVIFYNDVDSPISVAASDYYFTIIQLADPNVDGGTTKRSKVIEVNNITTEG